MVVHIQALMSWFPDRWGFLLPFVLAFSVIYNNVLGIFENVQWVMGQFDALTMPSLGSHGINVATMGLINYVIPLDLALSLFVLYVPLMLACAVIRIIKSFIPTVAT